MEKFNLNKFKEAEGKEQFMVKSQLGLQLWKTQNLRWGPEVNIWAKEGGNDRK
jgi:hypothetical protein